MFNVNNVLPTPYKDRKMKICRSDGSDRKRTEERRKLIFKTTCVSSQNNRMKKEEGAAVDSSAIFYPTFSQRAVSLLRL